MSLIQKIAEEKIKAAIERGELKDLPGQGKPLDLEDDANVPEELRVAYRLLKNSGYLPPEIQLRNEINEVEELLLQVDTEVAEKKLIGRLNLLKLQLNKNSSGSTLLIQETEYRKKLLDRIRD